MKLQSSLQSVEKKRTSLTISYFLSFAAPALRMIIFLSLSLDSS
ncbi:hypothetical protein LCGC14_2825440 [marine sediment metagenome]|uniref:Uncharacterized protein n=1 Tax=marine sediment metagenome TaxID=412755 RepID=A0A0F8YFQ4_9ZZZZ